MTDPKSKEVELTAHCTSNTETVAADTALDVTGMWLYLEPGLWEITLQVDYDLLDIDGTFAHASVFVADTSNNNIGTLQLNFRFIPGGVGDSMVGSGTITERIKLKSGLAIKARAINRFINTGSKIIVQATLFDPGQWDRPTTFLKAKRINEVA